MSPEHGQFTIEKVIAASPAAVFRAYAEEELKRQWFVDSDGPGWTKHAYSLDFRPGGTETGAFELAERPGAGLHENATTYLDIVDGERIVYAYTMAWNGRVHSASLATVSFAATEAGCRLTVTEQGAHFPPSDGPEMRRGGVEAQLDALVKLFAE